jgi:cytochrome c oxidase subunit 2
MGIVGLRPGVSIDWHSASGPRGRRPKIPSEIRVVKGQPVTFVLSTPDFPHGFALPDFNLRRDLIPGKEVELTFTPDKAGKFHMLCDNFCGEGHDRMSGWLIVTDA